MGAVLGLFGFGDGWVRRTGGGDLDDRDAKRMVHTFFVNPCLPADTAPGEPREEAEDTPKTMSFMHLHLGLEGALPDGTDVSGLATLQYLFGVLLDSFWRILAV